MKPGRLYLETRVAVSPLFLATSYPGFILYLEYLVTSLLSFYWQIVNALDLSQTEPGLRRD
jgi:hypothetical protein